MNEKKFRWISEESWPLYTREATQNMLIITYLGGVLLNFLYRGGKYPVMELIVACIPATFFFLILFVFTFFFLFIDAIRSPKEISLQEIWDTFMRFTLGVLAVVPLLLFIWLV